MGIMSEDLKESNDTNGVDDAEEEETIIALT